MPALFWGPTPRRIRRENSVSTSAVLFCMTDALRRKGPADPMGSFMRVSQLHIARQGRGTPSRLLYVVSWLR